ncbi:MAG: TOBE domain-containing protein [Verrucomicrobiota bacterium]
MKISARNLIKGTVKKITNGALNAEVILDIGGGVEIVSQITLGSVKTLKLKKGKTAYAVIKADNVLIGVDD